MVYLLLTAHTHTRAATRLALTEHRRYDPERLSICSAAANDDVPAIEGLLAQGVHVDSRHRLRTCRGWHHERYTPLISACSQVRSCSVYSDIFSFFFVWGEEGGGGRYSCVACLRGGGRRSVERCTSFI